MHQVYNRVSEKETRRHLRTPMPPAEVVLWSRLRGKQLGGLKFRRQHSIGPYVVDFYCPKAWLAVEVDGDTHDYTCAQDREREEYIKRLGVTVLRFTNTDVYNNVEGVVSTILSAVGQIGEFADG